MYCFMATKKGLNAPLIKDFKMISSNFSSLQMVYSLLFTIRKRNFQSGCCIFLATLANDTLVVWGLLFSTQKSWWKNCGSAAQQNLLFGILYHHEIFALKLSRKLLKLEMTFYVFWVTKVGDAFLLCLVWDFPKIECFKWQNCSKV